jgi:hypothetical protein
MTDDDAKSAVLGRYPEAKAIPVWWGLTAIAVEDGRWLAMGWTVTEAWSVARDKICDPW